MPYPITIHFALIGIGINMMKSGVLGYSIPKASRIPKIAPLAPTVIR